MPNNNESPVEKSSDFSPILQLRQDDVVAISVNQYNRLISLNICLEILRQKRLNEIRQKSYLNLEDNDFLLGGDVVAAVHKKLAEKGDNE